MDPNVHEWANLLIRWFHVVAGVTWLGQTYLFNFMEKTMAETAEAEAKGNIAGRLWMVHGGGFYQVEKQKVPELMPRDLHWFKWESALTWLSGLLLLGLVYYHGGLMVELDAGMSAFSSMLVGLASLVLAWAVYLAVWRSPLGANEFAGAAVSWALIVLAAWLLPRFMSPRAAYMHVGAMFGTIMTANVWMVILPGQTRMLEAVKAGRAPDLAKGLAGKRASKHNTYLSVPLLFLMISNHFPTASYGSEHAWAVLGVLVLVGWGAARLLRGSF